MGKSGISISTASEGMPRPSLFSSGSPATDHNIFDAMVGSDPASGHARKPRRLVWLLVPLIAATAWGISTQLRQAPVVRPVALAPAATPAPVLPAPATVVAPVEQPIPGATTALAVSDAGTVSNPFNNLPSSTGAASQPASAKPGQEPAAFDMQAALNAPNPPATPESRARISSTPGKVAGVPPAPAEPAQAASAGVAPKTTMAKAKPPSAGRSEPNPDSTNRVASRTASVPAKKPAVRDPDVELLSAIMKHLGDENGTAAAPARSEQTIADLVRSCKRNDSIEALLCQRRICEGSWGKAQACPQNLAPPSGAARATTAKAPT